ncbi:efflux RND transporter permease subunit [Variovorax saccharolyticus]|uniref:efflux RND transporter permease subunit n=1 Tax=Variovorax saccharolyticus TaxID=3053516 RepID=UPI0025770295|nr:efflux RND transporter permease subunit [Variovorax sp. J31P216]MDM0029082.1 efflux RND transporter permease subunit [Variovorax sp. J31P216]
MARFFIDRPIFAIVLAILVMLAGALSIFTLPVEQYPQIAPPSVQVSTTYPGASATTVQDTVVQVIEQSMNGIDHLLYIASVGDDTGQSTTTLTFAPGANPDIAQVQVQNKLQLATPLLPLQVQQTGVRVTKSSGASLLVPAFVSTDGSMNKFDIANYVVSHIQDPVSRINGVGNLNVFGTQYAIRIWLDPLKLYSHALTPVNVTEAVAEQNVQISGGQLGGAPAVGHQQLTATITAATLLRTPEEFGAILLKELADGSQVRLRDVSRIELGAESFAVDTRYNGRPAAGIAVQLATGANALQTAKAVRARIEELSQYFPPGLKVVYPNDSTPFIRESIKEVVKTLFEGIGLVILVMLLFLHNIRATVIPAIAVPVVLLGTFGVMAVLGFTINALSMFGLVLAIGLLVDDAIVVVENVQRVMEEEGLPAVEATRKAMGQISGALVGVAMVLCAVFVPVAFSSGTVGAIYRQFSLTIVSAMLLSVFVALTLTPALCALILKPSRDAGAQTTGFAGWFERNFERARIHYVHGVCHVIGRSGRWFAVYAVMLAAVVWLFSHLPTSFLPTEDQGFLFIQVQTPPGATMERTGVALDAIADYLATNEGDTVESNFLVNGFNFAGRGQNQGLVYVQLKDWSQRTRRALSANALIGRLGQRFASYKDAVIIPINPPAIQGLGTAAGFDFQLQDRGGVGHERLTQALDRLLELARHEPDLALVRRNGLADNPTFRIDADREKASALGVSIADSDQAFSIAWGSRYVNNFLDTDGRIKKVYVQADAPFRMNPEDLDRLYVRNGQGGMAPFSSFARGSWTFGPAQLQRYNGVSAIEIQGQAAPGRTTGQAIAAMERLMKQMPQGIGFEWTGVSLQQQQSGSQAPYFYALSILVVFLCLAALYESWSIPVSVMLVIPLGVVGALAATSLAGLSNDVYFQVGLLTTIGLSAKNAILIVEFARDLQAHGKSARDAAIEAAHMRLRPIVMTSLAFGLGVLPLALANGAGSASQNAIGVGVIGGVVTATFLAIFMIPMFYVVVASRVETARRARPLQATSAIATLEGG